MVCIMEETLNKTTIIADKYIYIFTRKSVMICLRYLKSFVHVIVFLPTVFRSLQISFWKGCSLFSLLKICVIIYFRWYFWKMKMCDLQLSWNSFVHKFLLSWFGWSLVLNPPFLPSFMLFYLLSQRSFILCYTNDFSFK